MTRSVFNSVFDFDHNRLQFCFAIQSWRLIYFETSEVEVAKSTDDAKLAFACICFLMVEHVLLFSRVLSV